MVWWIMADKNKKEKTFKKIKKKNIWSSIVAVVLFSILSVLVLAAIIHTLTLYVIDEKLSAEYESIKDMGKLYEGKVISDLSGLYSLLDSQDRDYVIVNEAGNVLHQKGEATYSAEKKEMSLSDHSESIFVYTDTTERGVLFIDQRGLVSVDMRKLHA